MAKNNEQKEFFLRMWEERPHICELCEAHLGYEPMAYYFSHILGKGAYPRIKLLEKNLMFNCFKCHREWDAGSPEGLKNYQKMSDLRDELRIMYNTNQI